MLLLPHHPGFYEIYYSALPPGYKERNRFARNTALVVDHQTGAFREANYQQLQDYLFGGEYHLMLETFGADNDDSF